MIGCCGGGGRFSVFGGNADPNYSVFDADRKRGQAGLRLGMIGDAAVGEIERPSMERTDDFGTGEDAVGERAAAVRAFVFDGAKFVAKVEESD